MVTYCGFSRVYNVIYFSLLDKIKGKSVCLRFLVEHVFPRFQFMHVRLASYGRRTSKESLLLKKECYPRVLRTLWVRRCTNEDIGKDMNIISDWLLQYVRRKERFFPSCNRAVCVPRKGRIV